jgi:inorganic pyrophosphatase
MNLHQLPPGPNPPHIVNAIIEISRGGHHKYEYNPELGLFKLDRVLYSAVHYPAAYGFIPGTLAEDGDPVDILVITSEPTFTGCLIEARPVGLFRMRDEKGDDENILSVPVADPHHNEIRELSQVRTHFLREVEHFFHIYKELEGKAVETLGWEDKEAALSVIQKAIDAAMKQRAHKRG